MHETVKNLLKIKQNIKTKLPENSPTPKIIAVSKTFSMDHIKHLIEYGHKDYGENKVQEANEKWLKIRSNKDIKLHLIGRLQSNKVKIAVKLFDYIHSLDSIKLANRIALQEKELNKKVKIFIQVNLGNEDQKSGINKNDLISFHNYCKNLDLNVIGLMCIPPFNEPSLKYFKELKELNNKLNLNELSMGMSSDYLEAIENGSTQIRIGSSIFGQRS